MARAFHNVDRLNSAWINSGIDGRAILVGVEELDPGDRIRAETDAHIQALREVRGADVVSVVIGHEEANICGSANLMTRSRVGPQMAPMAFHYIAAHCFNGSIFIHETGHVFGAQHDVENAGPPSQGAFPFAYGHGGGRQVPHGDGLPVGL